MSPLNLFWMIAIAYFLIGSTSALSSMVLNYVWIWVLIKCKSIVSEDLSARGKNTNQALNFKLKTFLFPPPNHMYQSHIAHQRHKEIVQRFTFVPSTNFEIVVGSIENCKVLLRSPSHGLSFYVFVFDSLSFTVNLGWVLPAVLASAHDSSFYLAFTSQMTVSIMAFNYQAKL